MSDNWEKVEIGLTEMVDWDQTPSVTGKLSEVRTEVGPNSSNIYVLDQEDSSKISFWGNTVLDGKFKVIELGTLCKVNFLGMQQGKAGRKPYRNFDVFTKK